MLRPQKGNMYSFISHTWNAIKGKCSHECSYCYMKPFALKPIRLDESELKTDLGKDNFIFVGSGTDMFAEDVPEEWISRTLKRCREFDKNKYLFQSKNPARFLRFTPALFGDMILGTTMESDRIYKDLSKAPDVFERAKAMRKLSECGYKTMVTIEPILDFLPMTFLDLIKMANPTWVNIGADSKGHKLPEPSKEKLDEFIKKLQTETDVKLKTNLNRIR